MHLHMNSTFYYYACSVYSARDGIELVYYTDATDATDTMMTTYQVGSSELSPDGCESQGRACNIPPVFEQQGDSSW